jgi:hypothetical protein
MLFAALKVYVNRFNVTPSSIGLAVAISLVGCFGSKISTSDSQDVLSNSNYYLSDKAQVRVYWKDSGLGTFVTRISPVDGKINLPSSLRKGGDFGDRNDTTTPNALDLLAMVYHPNHPSGDNYFETLLLGPTSSVTNVTTALSWFLRFSFGSQKIKISQYSFEQLVTSIEVGCRDCRLKTNSEVLSMIVADTELQKKLLALVKSENPDMNLNISWAPPEPQWIWSEPAMTAHGIVTKDLGETDTITTRALYIDYLQSTKNILPTSWDHIFDSITQNSPVSDYTYTFNYEDSGTHTLIPKFISTITPDDLNFVLSVNDLNRAPVCQDPLVINMQANHLNSVDLSPYCVDPDKDETTTTYSLANGPLGLMITALGRVRWTPAQRNDGLSYDEQVTFSIADSHLSIAPGKAKIHVSPDNTPTFSSLNASYNVTEGQEATIVVNATDIDGDPLKITLLGLDAVYNGFPDGAGSLNNITRTGSAGNYSFTIRFTPSYLQRIGSDGTLRLKFSIQYDSTTGDYDSTINFDEREVTLNVTNVDDPPIWDTQPLDFAATEAVDVGPIILGHATDSPANPTTITYSVAYLGDDHCNWGTLTATPDGSGNIVLSGLPPYFTSTDCSFLIRATDQNNLMSESGQFIITTTNVNQPLTLLGSPLTLITGLEGKNIAFPLDQMFADADIGTDPSDDREHLTYDCLVDTDSNGSYESTCVDVGLNIQFSSNNFSATYTPPPFSAGSYKIRLTATDVGATSATNDFVLQIDEAPTPMTLSTIYGGVEVATINANENATTNFSLRATPASARPVDSYDFRVATPTCSVVGAGGTCSVGMVKAPGTLTGTGSTDFIFTLKPAYTDADSIFPETTKNYLISFYAYNTADPTVYMRTTVNLTVNNTNRAPTAISITKNGSFGCTGTTANALTDIFTICIDANQDTKAGNSWTKSYSLTMAPVDADTINDLYSFSFSDPIVPGSIYTETGTGTSIGTWTFKLPSCLTQSNSTVTRSYMLQLSDGRGGTVTREIRFKVNKASASYSCM